MFMKKSILLQEIDNHIELVGNNIDIISSNLNNETNFSDNINNITLIDLILYLSNNLMLPKYDTLVDVNNNSYMTISFLRQQKNKKEIIDYIKKELQLRKIYHDKFLIKEIDIENLKTLNIHYFNTRHHPEYFEKCIRGMNILDVTEMFCDWCAICKMYEEDIFKTIESKEQEYKTGKTLTRVLKNTADKYFNK